MSNLIQVNNLPKRPQYRPEKPLEMIPIYRWPPQLAAIFKWLFGFPSYLWPFSTLFVGIAILTWLFLTPDTNTIRIFSVDWVALIFLRNLLLTIIVAGALHVWLYVRKAQGTEYRYNGKWLSVDDRTFLFRDQVWDNIFRTVCSAVPIWTAYEVLLLWMQVNGFASTVSWRDQPVYCVGLILLAPIWHSIYFYTTHRFIHWRPLFRWVHSVHHKNVNIGPWSGLAMHPIEHLLFFSEVMVYSIIPSHPVHVILHLQLLALGAILGHVGFDRVVLIGKFAIPSDYMHYLHHKHVRVNYGDLLVPLDVWFGTFHNGSDEAQDELKRRARARISRSRSAS